MATTFLKLPTVKSRTTLSRSSIYRLISKGTFPKPISLGARGVAWNELDIEKWMEQRIEETRAQEAGQ